MIINTEVSDLVSNDDELFDIESHNTYVIYDNCKDSYIEIYIDDSIDNLRLKTYLLKYENKYVLSPNLKDFLQRFINDFYSERDILYKKMRHEYSYINNQILIKSKENVFKSFFPLKKLGKYRDAVDNSLLLLREHIPEIMKGINKLDV